MSEPSPNPQLLELIAQERGALVDPGPARDRLAARLVTRLAQATGRGSPTRSQAPLGRWWQRHGVVSGVGVFSAGVVAGGLAVRSLMTAHPLGVEVRYVDRIVAVDAAPDSGARIAVPPSTPPAPSSSSSAPTNRSVRPAPTVSSSQGVSSDDLARERQLVEMARSALARRDAKAALEAIDEHARLFPRGQLTEMREALAVQALVTASRPAEARARATRYHRLFPASVYGPVVDAAILSIP